jgi:hypothetical protein
MPFDKRKLDALLEEIAILDKEVKTHQKRRNNSRISQEKHSLDPLKRLELAETEKQVYNRVNHYFKLIMISFQNAEVGLQIWIKGALPLLLEQYNLELEEWERICDIGDNDPEIQKELDESWKDFFQNVVQAGKIEDKILSMINEGKKKDEWRSKSANR